MKRFSFFLLLFSLVATTAVAQEIEPVTPDTIPIRPENVKSFDGFLLDMSLMPSFSLPSPYLAKPTLLPPDASKDFSYLFRLDNKATYTQGAVPSFSLGGAGGFGLFDVNDNLQMGSFRLKNGMRLNTYGQYDKDGRRVFNPSALPWERNDFKGAFELKSANGNFGIRVEVEKRR